MTLLGYIKYVGGWGVGVGGVGGGGFLWGP